jgi:hypothetical protein
MITRTSNVDGTSLKGYVNTTFNKLVEAFGQPCFNNPPSQWDKVTTEWKLKFPCDTVATIYNWKNYGFHPEPYENYEWHIGGYTSDAVDLVINSLKK